MTFEGLNENFKFLVLETQSQVSSTLEFLKSPTQADYDKILSRDDYIDNLKNIIENECYSRINAEKDLPKIELNRIRATQTIAVNLERIADNCVNIVGQTQYLDDQHFLDGFDYVEGLEEIRDSIFEIIEAWMKRDLALALTICKTEHKLDVVFKKDFDCIMERLTTGKDIQNLITTLFIVRYLERMGDSMLNVGEALILGIVGEKIKINQFHSLQETLSKSGFKGAVSDVGYQSILGTRSGCRIGHVEQVRQDDTESRESIFKEGNPAKIKKEKDNLQKWEELFPGLVPKVFSFHEAEESSSILVQFLPGASLEEIVLNASPKTIEESFNILISTLREIWDKTLIREPIHSDFMRQVKSRLSNIKQVHPELFRSEQNLGNSKIYSSADLIEACARYEKKLPAPFTVFIHGDFNVNNIVFNQTEQRIHFIDLYRSKQADYAQDVSVFLVSNFRLPVFDVKMRKKLNWVIQNFLSAAKDFATDKNDSTFDIRMALALARSFYTSVRFELNQGFSKDMYKRAHFLLEKVSKFADAGREPEDFELPESILYY